MSSGRKAVAQAIVSALNAGDGGGAFRASTRAVGDIYMDGHFTPDMIAVAALKALREVAGSHYLGTVEVGQFLDEIIGDPPC